MNIPKVISLVVDQDLCTGCGVCTSQCPSKSISMGWNGEGFFVPKETQNECLDEGNCIVVCPFNPFPKNDVRTEDELAELFLDTEHSNGKIGKYESLFVGYSTEFRETSSSGGLATYFIGQLFERKLVDAAIIVKSGPQPDRFYEYSTITDRQQLLSSSKTRYYPVNLEEALDRLRNFKGRVAIVGVSCFVKAIRLKQKEDEIFDEKVGFLVGIICGGLKSKYYTDFLAFKAIGGREKINNPGYRIKKPENKASDYYFGLEYREKKQLLRMKEVGDMWGTGFFKSNACDFCEDVASELADVSLGDAWLDPYVNDGMGNSVIVSRNKLADTIILEGISKGELVLEDLTVEGLLKSQSGSFNHRQKGLKYRLERRNNKGKLTPPKRDRNLTDISFSFKCVQFLRQIVRRNSTRYWLRSKNGNDFEKKMKPSLFLLKVATKIYRTMLKG